MSLQLKELNCGNNGAGMTLGADGPGLSSQCVLSPLPVSLVSGFLGGRDTTSFLRFLYDTPCVGIVVEAQHTRPCVFVSWHICM